MTCPCAQVSAASSTWGVVDGWPDRGIGSLVALTRIHTKPQWPREDSNLRRKVEEPQEQKDGFHAAGDFSPVVGVPLFVGLLDRVAIWHCQGTPLTALQSVVAGG